MEKTLHVWWEFSHPTSWWPGTKAMRTERERIAVLAVLQAPAQIAPCERGSPASSPADIVAKPRLKSNGKWLAKHRNLGQEKHDSHKIGEKKQPVKNLQNKSSSSHRWCQELTHQIHQTAAQFKPIGSVFIAIYCSSKCAVGAWEPD